MSWRLEVRHTTVYRYARPVVASYNEARLTPAATAGQRPLATRVDVEPACPLFRFTDYWGTTVHAFDVHEPHTSLVVTGSSTVETGISTARRAVRATAVAQPSGHGEPPATGPTWADLAAGDLTDPFYEMLAPSRYVDPSQLAVAARKIRAGCTKPSLAPAAVAEWAHGQLVYEPGTTHAHTSAIEAWGAGRGVCQDFTHLSLGALRAMGIPARYVSGYFFPGAITDVGSKVTGESHAWVEAWVGEWVAIDPTNRVPVRERHIVVARGRDYSDVAPLRGIYSGPPGSRSEVTVELTRLA